MVYSFMYPAIHKSMNTIAMYIATTTKMKINNRRINY